jgi:hypothetical protein
LSIPWDYLSVGLWPRVQARREEPSLGALQTPACFIPVAFNLSFLCSRWYHDDLRLIPQKYACKLRIVTCAACGTEMEAYKMRTHCRFDCEFRLVPCGGAATLALQQLRKDAHDKLKLKGTVVPVDVESDSEESDVDETSEGSERSGTYCGNHPSCGALIPFNQLKDHLSHHCVNRPIACRCVRNTVC